MRATYEQLKKVLDAVRELITDANFECSEDGIVSRLSPPPITVVVVGY